MIEIQMETAESQEKGFDPEAPVARQVLKAILGDGFSPADEEQHAAAWEATTGIPLKRAWESWAEYAARKKTFVSTKRKQTFFTDPASATESLKRLLDKARSGTALTKREIAEAHELEEMLGRSKTDFSKPLAPPPEDAAAASLRRFTRIKERPTWDERVKLVEKENDMGALHLTILRDEREEVRQAARERMMQIELASS